MFIWYSTRLSANAQSVGLFHYLIRIFMTLYLLVNYEQLSFISSFIIWITKHNLKLIVKGIFNIKAYQTFIMRTIFEWWAENLCVSLLQLMFDSYFYIPFSGNDEIHSHRWLLSTANHKPPLRTVTKTRLTIWPLPHV